MEETYEFAQFWPAVGLRYKDSSMKLLVLGESHYRWETMPEDRRLTTRFAIKAKEDYPFWRNIAGLFDRKSDFWDEVIFYNFVQEYVGIRPRQRPKRSMFESDAAVKGFREILRRHAPSRILVIGKANWTMLPGDQLFPGKTPPRVESRFPLGEVFSRGILGSDRLACWYPTTDDEYALCAAIFHPGYPKGSIWQRQRRS